MDYVKSERNLTRRNP